MSRLALMSGPRSNWKASAGPGAGQGQGESEGLQQGTVSGTHGAFLLVAFFLGHSLIVEVRYAGSAVIAASVKGSVIHCLAAKRAVWSAKCGEAGFVDCE